MQNLPISAATMRCRQIASDAARALCAWKMPKALALARRGRLTVPPRILISGSLYLAGHVLDINGTPPA
jgi:dihydrofolate synthase/folylpolyglutamate synthase